MFERYTEKARRVVFFARYEASQLGSAAIDAEHLLLGLLREDKDLLARFLPGRSISITGLRNRILHVIGENEKVSASVDLPLTQRAKQVLNHAAEESMQLQDGYIGPEHLLLGLLHDDKSPSHMILHELGLDANLVRERMGNREEAIYQEGGPRESLKWMLKDMRELAAQMQERIDGIEEMLNRLSDGDENRDEKQ